MNTRYYRCLSRSLIGCCLIFLLAACGSGSPTGVGQTPTPSGAGTPPAQAHGSPTPTATLPATQTSCPAAGTARAAVMTPFKPGSHQNIVYIVNEFQGHNPTFGTLKRYDVTTGNKTEIIKLPNVTINDAQLSADGQWIVFSINVGGTEKLQLVRMDGQELQTLYCMSSASDTHFFYDLQWSANQQLIAFVSNLSSDISLLNAQSGSLQRVFHPKTLGSNGIEGYRLETWLDATRLYVLTQPLDQPADTLSILDITRGSDQDSSNLRQVFHSEAGFCWDNNSSYDGTALFTSQCTGGDPRAGSTQGPSTITVEPATGGSLHTIYKSSTLAITNMRSITNNTLFYRVGNTSGDSSKNGLWKINTDGTGNTFLTSISAGGPNSSLGLNQFTQYPWSNFSRDNSMYALERVTAQKGNVTNTLFFGSLKGGSPTTFAAISGTVLALVGWTTM
jgi:eukaryotic-like serine/threonine-protein kinase